MSEYRFWNFWRSPDRVYVFWQFLLIAAITASVVLNGLHAALGVRDVGGGAWYMTAAVVGAVIPPAFFFAIVEGALMVWERQMSRLGSVVLAALVFAAGGAAAARSFFGLVDFSEKFDVLPPEHAVWLKYMLPFITDVLALAATVVLFQLKGAPERRTRKPKQRRAEHDIAAIGFFPRMRVMLFGGARRVPTLPEAQVPAVHHNGHPVPVPGIGHPVPEPYTPVPVDARTQVPAPVPSTGIGQAPMPVGGARAPMPVLDYRALAQRLVDEGTLAIDPERIARAMELREQGMSRDDIAATVGMAQKTASKILRALNDEKSKMKSNSLDPSMIASNFETVADLEAALASS